MVAPGLLPSCQKASISFVLAPSLIHKKWNKLPNHPSGPTRNTHQISLSSGHHTEGLLLPIQLIAGENEAWEGKQAKR